MIRRAIAPALALAVLLTACTSGDDEHPTPSDSPMQAIMATTDLYTGAPQRVGVGLVLNDGRLVSFGTASFAFSYLGTSSAASNGPAGPAVRAGYVPTPGTPSGGAAAQITQPAEGRGIYEAEHVTFDRAGYWQVEATARVGGSTMRASSAFSVADAPALPAPGQPALRTDNLTMASIKRGNPAGAVDSRAVADGKVPDPELHEWTIAEALREHRPVVAVFATPVYCVSQFCGPVTDAVDALWRKYRDRAVFVHVEIWRDYNAQPQEINKAAADWLLRNGDLTEPWLYLIGANGTILDRWSSLFDSNEVAAELRKLPEMH